MWKRFKHFHKDDKSSELEYLRFMYGLMGIALGFFTVWNLLYGSNRSLQLVVMGLLAALGIVGVVAYSKLLKERAADTRKP